MMSFTRKKRKIRVDACSCIEVFLFFGWGLLDIKKLSVDEDIFLVVLFEVLLLDVVNV